MAISHFSTVTANSGNTAGGTTTQSVTLPASLQAGDFAIVSLSRGNQTAFTTNPTSLGFTQLTDVDVSTTQRLSVWYKKLTSSDSSTTVTATWTTASFNAMSVSVYRGVDTTGTGLDATSVSGTKATASTTFGTLPSITTATNNAWIVYVAANRRSATGNAPPVVTPPTTPAVTERADHGTNRSASNNVSSWHGDLTKGTAGSQTGPTGGTLDLSSTNAFYAIALKPGLDFTGGASATTVTVGRTAAGGGAGDPEVDPVVTITATGNVATFGDANVPVSFDYGDTFATVPTDKDITLRTVFPLGFPAVNTNVNGDATRSQTVSITATGANSVTGSASALAESVTITAAGNRTNQGSATVANTVTISSTGSVNAPGNATLSTTVSLSSTGNKAAFGDASRASTVSITSTATVGKFGDATLAETVALSSTANKSVFGAATVSETVSITATGVASGSNNATLNETVTITAAGLAQYQQGASLTASVGITTAGTVGRIGDATRSVTVGLSSTGSAGLATGATVSESVSITADGSKTVNASTTTLAESVTITASATVEIPTPLDSYLQANIMSSASGFITKRVANFSPPTRDIAYGRKVAPKAWWVKKEEGITLLREGGVWRQTVNPSNDEIVAAERCYLGGRNYQLDATQESELIAAGYGDLITEEYVNV